MANFLYLYPNGGTARASEGGSRAHAVNENTGRALCGSGVRIWAIDSDALQPTCRRCKVRLGKRRKRDTPRSSEEAST